MRAAAPAFGDLLARSPVLHIHDRLSCNRAAFGSQRPFGGCERQRDAYRHAGEATVGGIEPLWDVVCRRQIEKGVIVGAPPIPGRRSDGGMQSTIVLLLCI